MSSKTKISRREFLNLSNVFIASMLLSSVTPALSRAVGAKPKGVKSEKYVEFLSVSNPNEYVQQLKSYTDLYKELTAKKTNVAIREIECLKLHYMLGYKDINSTDLFAGRYTEPLACFTAQAKSGFGYSLNEGAIAAVLENETLTPANKNSLIEIRDFWQKNNSTLKTRNTYPQAMREMFGSERWLSDPIIGAPLYRISGTQCDYDKLITLGVDGLMEEVLKYKKHVKKGSDKYNTYVAMEGALNLFSELVETYAHRITENAHKNPNSADIVKTLNNIAHRKPATFREGAQLMFLWSIAANSINYGRMDEYLGDLYVHDIDNGVMSEEDAIALLSNLWVLIDARDDIWNQRIIIGGKGRRNEKNADRLALTIMETTRRVKGIVPQLTLRFYKGQDLALYSKALDVVATGNPYPMLYNDDVNIPAVMSAFDLPRKEAQNYLPFGCGEYIIDHRSLGTPSGVINILQALTVVLHHGVNPISGERVPAVTLPKYNTFEELMSCYKKTVEMYVEQLALQEKLEYDMAAKDGNFLYASMLFDDCIKEGKGLIDGVKYLGGTLESYGNTNTADALTAIRKLVYEDKTVSYDEMIAALDADFKGYELVRKKMLDAPKYGNDDKVADDMVLDVNNHICNFTRSMAPKVGLDSYMIVIINNDANVSMGRNTAASPDGRHSRTYMSNANGAVGGADKSGATAYLNSISQINTHIFAGAVQNFKLSREMLTTYRATTEKLLDVYWEKGGAQLMINCLNRDDLENAMKYPEKYTNLIVRVGGFSARFVELARDVQLEILSRTLY